MADTVSITPQVRRKVYSLLRNKSLTLRGSKNFLQDPDDAFISAIAHELQRQLHALGYDWDNDTQHVAMRQKQWAVIFRQWPTPPVDILHACRPHNLQVVPNKGSANLIALRKRAAGIHPSNPAWTPPPPPPPSPPPPPQMPCDPSLRKYNKTGKYSKKRALHAPGTT